MAGCEMVTMLMFTGRAQEAIDFYVGLFDDAGIDIIQHYEPGSPGGMEGQIVHARFHVCGQQVLAMDSPPVHDFTFTPSSSFFVTCKSAEEVDRLHDALSDGGGVLMELGEYPFAERYAWVNDRFGVSWQLIFGQPQTIPQS